MKRQYLLGIVTLIAGLSGFCGLVYQLIWHRAVEYSFGGDAVSSAIVTCTFLLGLGLGAYLCGKWRMDAYKTYASIQFIIGLFGILSFYLIAPGAAVLAQVLKPALDEAEGVRAAVVAGCIMLLLPPGILIGSILPLMLRCFVRPLGFSARTIGLISGINLLGASLGILAAPLFFLNRLSLPGTLVIIGSLNIVLGCALLWVRRLDAAQETTSPAAADAGGVAGPALAFVSGFIALSFAVSLLRALPIVNPSSAYNFPLALMFFLLALALGSIVFTRGLIENRDDILYRIGCLMAGSALGMFLGIWVASYLQANMYPISFLPILNGDGGNTFWALLFSAVLIMPAPLLIGAIFPLLLRLRAADEAGLPDSAGKIYLAVSLGGFCAVMLGTFAGFPVLGTRGFLTLVYVVTGASGLGVMAWIWRRNKAQKVSGALPAGMLAMCIIVAVLMPSGMWLTYITGGPEENWEVREGISGIGQLWWTDEFADIRVNGQYMSTLPYHPLHLKQEIFLLVQPKREKILVIGIGAAEIIRSLVEDAEVKSIDVVDTSRELPVLLAGGRAAEMLNHALASPKVRIHNADPRVAVGLYEPETFDLVFDNLASWVDSSTIKSGTYFRMVRRILKPEGVFVIAGNYRGESRLAVLAGLVQAFEIVKEHPTHDMTVIATSKEPEYTDARIIEVALPRAGEFGLNFTAPDALAAWFRNEHRVITGEQLMGVEPIRDDLLVYEYFWNPF
jgi:predicted membrane-bound spermidine synthase